MKYLDNFVNYIYKPPKEKYEELTQAIIDHEWENSTQNNEVILEQLTIGSDVYNTVDISVDMAID